MPISAGPDVPLKGYGNKTPTYHSYVEAKTTVIDTAKQKPVAGKRKKTQSARKVRPAPKASASSQRSYAKMPKMEEIAKLLIATNPNKRLTIEELIQKVAS